MELTLRDPEPKQKHTDQCNRQCRNNYSEDAGVAGKHNSQILCEIQATYHLSKVSNSISYFARA